MIKIKFNGTEEFREVTFTRTERTVTLTGITDGNISGFKTYRLNGDPLGDFSDFTTVYNLGDDYVTFSNDGSVKQEAPETPTEEPVTTVPTVEERLDAIDAAIEELAELVGGTE